ncbi:MAG TPA: phosphatase PAP2 family protein [Burkholderiaceae bacterium]|nr:phosphatase PAP2 family protein [Burkholderiaceae bacterium]
MQLWLERAVERWAARDLRWIREIHRAASWPLVIVAVVAASRLANGVLWYSLMVLCPLLGGVTGTACAMQMAGVGVLNLAIYRYLKPRVGRLRPCDTCPGVNARARPLDTYSFPSGHTLHTVSFCIVIIYHYPWAALLAGPFGLVVAISRLVLGLHYPSDVAVGALMGVATAALVLLVN